MVGRNDVRNWRWTLGHASVWANSRRKNDTSCLLNAIAGSEKKDKNRNREREKADLTEENLVILAFKWYHFHLSTICSCWYTSIWNMTYFGTPCYILIQICLCPLGSNSSLVREKIHSVFHYSRFFRIIFCIILISCIRIFREITLSILSILFVYKHNRHNLRQFQMAKRSQGLLKVIQLKNIAKRHFRL